uniref:Antitoxin n=1 Tax=Candidatus Kentrum sp. FM TaxID=2126340 RepID=A0A450W418_9GAMM|nr:MAG: hypothetical protein BECKFM1743C_GA0114222_102382 [Candidatus Kentron sp. FM]VFJ75532.1 MAG: hypothetical protein BECKFM1743A_GA0114220_108422 [Candidatus Kentron sp. FM]VFK11782.1 MAG: hypothetical protein BECKFM1743B_GA0114221_102072 [Candidatus Kentron sp. FM]
MQASILDLQYKAKDVLGAIDKNEVAVVTHEGKAKATLELMGEKQDRPASPSLLWHVSLHGRGHESGGSARGPFR